MPSRYEEVAAVFDQSLRIYVEDLKLRVHVTSDDPTEIYRVSQVAHGRGSVQKYSRKQLCERWRWSCAHEEVLRELFKELLPYVKVRKELVIKAYNALMACEADTLYVSLMELSKEIAKWQDLERD